MSAVILILVLGVALLYEVRSQTPPLTTQSPAPPTVSVALATTSPTPSGGTPTPALTFVRCGTLAANSITTGQGSGANIYELRSPTGVTTASFGWPGSAQPALGTYICVRLTPGAPQAGFVALIAPGEPGYVARTWASACGTASDFVTSTSSANGSFVLSSPGRPPLKVIVSAGAGGQFAGYICASIYGTGAAGPTFAGLWAPGTDGFITEGTQPATKANPAPSGFVLPQACLYIAPPLTGADQTEWSVDCGATANRDARGTLAPALTQQGWTSCGSSLATATWAKGTARLVVAESSGSPGDYPKVAQPLRPAASGCP